MTGDISGYVDLSRIDMGRVKRIEVLKGAASSLYGSDAIAGVINIITDQPHDALNIMSTTPDFITFLRHHIAHNDNQRVT